jgi:ethanolamine ammonia-lyase small subunit
MTTYWTLFLTDLGDDPHSGLCHGQFTSPNQLWADLKAKHWNAELFRLRRARFARVTLTKSGFSVRTFQSLAAAVNSTIPRLPL